MVQLPFCVLSVTEPLAFLLQYRATDRRRNNERVPLRKEDQAVIRASVSHVWMWTMAPSAGHHGAIPQRLARQLLPEKKDESGPWGESGPPLGAGALTVTQMQPNEAYLLSGYLSGCV